MASLSEPGVAAVRWSVIASAARFGLQLGAQVLLARLLGPEVFGLFAIGLVLLTFAGFITSFGFSWSLLQRQVMQDEDVRFAWTWQVMVGAATTTLMFVFAYELAALFRTPEAEHVIAWLSMACVLQAASAPATYLLQRDLNFRAVGLIQVGSYALGYVAVGLPMALMGAGVQALVAAWLLQAGATLVASYALKPHSLRPLLWYPRAAQVMATGRAVFFTNLVNWTLNNLDRILIARLLNTQALGLYNVAYNLATVPNTVLLGALQPAFMAAGAKLQNERPRLMAAYRQMLSTLLVLGFPAFAALALLSPDLVRLLYGAQWTQAGPVLGLLFAFMPAFVIWGISTPVLWNTGRPNSEFALQLGLVPLGALAFYLTAPSGIVAAALVAGLLLAARALVLVWAALRALDLPWRSLAPAAWRGLLLTSITASSVLAGLQASQSWDQPLLSLACGGFMPLVVLGLPLVARPAWLVRLLGEDCWQMLLRFAPGLQRRVLDTDDSAQARAMRSQHP